MSRVARFGKDQSGNIMMMFGFACIPVIGLAGAMVDYSRASAVRASLDAAIDGAALMAARDVTKLTDAELRSRIDGWVRANLSHEAAANFTGATVTIDRAAHKIDITGEARATTTLTRVIGQDSIAVKSHSQSSWGTNMIELALALDNTGSMAFSGKMNALKAASLDLIWVMKKASNEADQIRISIVPFAARVRLDTSYKEQTWLRWSSSALKETWGGCVGDRDKPYDVQDSDAAPGATAYPAEQCDPYSPASLAKILPLTSDWTALTNRVNAMTPVGATNVTMGAVWGMATLSPGAPFTEAKPASTPHLKKYMILLTDGLNTKNRFDGNGFDDSPSVDERTKLACANAKAAGIAVYTIRVMDGNQNLLKNCASELGMYYDVQNASQLAPIFKKIAAEISSVRLSM